MLGRLRRNMTLLCASGVCVIGVVLVVISLTISERQLTDRGQALFSSNVGNIAFQVSNEPTLEWSWLAKMEADGGLWIYIVDNGSPMLFSTRTVQPGRLALVLQAQKEAARQHSVDVSQRPLSALHSNQAHFRMQGEDGAQYRVSVIAMRTERGHKSITVLGDTASEQAAIVRQRLLYLGLLVASVLALLLFSWWFTGRAVRPIAENQKRQTEFIAAASHELRSPLAVIRTSAAALRGAADNPFLNAIERECARTGKLVDELLVLASADAGSWRVELAPVELPELLAECVGGFQATATERGIRLGLSLPPTLPLIAGDDLRLRQLLAILLDNACRYTPPGGQIRVCAAAGKRDVQVQVADSGPGIPEAEREHVFERFYRADQSRTQKEHYGLGLSIAREIARLHHGRVTLAETPGGGLTAAVRLPLLSSPVGTAYFRGEDSV